MEQSTEDVALDFLSNIIKESPFSGKVYLAGGAVRDQMMGKQVKDIDLVISEKDGGIKFAQWLTQKLNIHSTGNPVIFPTFGTAKLNLRNTSYKGVDLSGIDIECVMTRGEKYTAGSRKPEVVYSDLKADVERRDLTVNSLLKNLTTGEVVDLTGKGLQDIKDGIVRTPLDPDITFKDDPLRMLRAIRFATKYNWKMPLSMVKALKRNAGMLQNISKERIHDELNKMLVTAYPDKALRIMSLTGLMQYVIPELDACRGVGQNQHHKDDVYDHILEVVKNTPPNLIARLAALFHDIGKPQTKTSDRTGIHFIGHEATGADTATEVMKRLKYSNAETKSVADIVNLHMRLKAAGDSGEGISDKALRKFSVAIGDNLTPALMMMHGDNISHAEESKMPNQIPALEKRFALLAKEPSAKSKLPIDGHDISLALGIKPGPVFKNILQAVEDAWFENPALDKATALNIAKAAYKKIAEPAAEEPSKQIKPSADLTQKIHNPETDNDIMIKTALGYDKNHPAYIAAANKIKK